MKKLIILVLATVLLGGFFVSAFGEATDTYSGVFTPITAPGEHCFPITTSNSATLTDQDGNSFVPRGVWVGGAGNVDVRMYGKQNDVDFDGAAAGTFIVVRPDMVYNTTTATGLVGCY